MDYQCLNVVTEGDSFPLPNITENLERLEGFKVFSTLDSHSAYWQVPVAKDFRPYLAFVTPEGTFKPTQMPMGGKNTASCYARFKQILLDKLNSQNTLCYLDNVIIGTKDDNRHLEELEKVFKIQREAILKLNTNKKQVIYRRNQLLGVQSVKEEDRDERQLHREDHLMA